MKPRLISSLFLLISCHIKGNISLGEFNHLEKADITSKLVNLLILCLFYTIYQCLAVAGTLFGIGTTYNDEILLHTTILPLLFYIETLVKSMQKDTKV